MGGREEEGREGERERGMVGNIEEETKEKGKKGRREEEMERKRE